MDRLIRSIFALAAIGLLSHRAAATAAAADQPIPQDLARQERALRDLLGWNRRTLVGAYDQVGKKSAKWDKPAREALEAAARFASRAVDPAAGFEDVFAPAKLAVEMGCDDPLILSLYADSSRIAKDIPPAELDRRYSMAATAIERSGYPPVRRVSALLDASTSKLKQESPTGADRKEAERLLAVVLTLIPSGTAKSEGEGADDKWYNLFKEAIDDYRLLGLDTKAAIGRLDPAMAKTANAKTLRLQLTAQMLIAEGWEIRGNGMGDSVTDEAQRKFRAKNLEAARLLQQAWALNPRSWRTPTMMVHVVNNVDGKREEMETWFRRAMQLKDNNVMACTYKLNYLDPKWHGSREEMFAFADDLKATKNWMGGIRVLSVPAHIRWTLLLDDEATTRYYRTPSVWEDGRSLYEEHLAHHTRDHAVRSEYAGFAYFCGQREAAAVQFKILGDRIVGSRFYPSAQLQQFKASLDDEEKRKKP